MIGIVVLLIHDYYNCYTAFKSWGLVSAFSDRILINLTHTGLLKVFLKIQAHCAGLSFTVTAGCKRPQR